MLRLDWSSNVHHLPTQVLPSRAHPRAAEDMISQFRIQDSEYMHKQTYLVHHDPLSVMIFYDVLNKPQVFPIRTDGVHCITAVLQGFSSCPSNPGGRYS